MTGIYADNVILLMTGAFCLFLLPMLGAGLYEMGKDAINPPDFFKSIPDRIMCWTLFGLIILVTIVSIGYIIAAVRVLL